MLSVGGWVLLIWVQKSLFKWGQTSLYPCLLYARFRHHPESWNKLMPEVLPGFLQVQLASVVLRDQSPIASYLQCPCALEASLFIKLPLVW